MFDVILDYGKRFPDVRMKDLGLDFTKELMEDRISDLFRIGSRLKIEQRNHIVFMFSGEHKLYFSDCVGQWERVPNHIILRFATEGKEDLI